MNKWTLEQLENIDNITFAMSILSERAAKLNPNSPLARKLNDARHSLDILRGAAPLPHGYSCVYQIEQRIFKEVSHRNVEQEVVDYITNHSNEIDGYDKILENEELISRIAYRVEKHRADGDYQYDIERAIEKWCANYSEVT